MRTGVAKTVMYVLCLCCMCVCCESARVTAKLMWVRVRCGCGECMYEWYTWFRVFCLVQVTCL